MKKFLALAMSATLLCGAMTACGGAQEESADAPAASEKSKPLQPLA